MPASRIIADAYSEKPRAVSKRSLCIAGISVTVFGLEEIRGENGVACLWLLHPRLQDKSSMEPIAFSAINAWNDHLQSSDARADLPGLVAASFDQRNHGSRIVDKLANEDWRSGNKRHAQDMFASYHGTAVDTSHLLSYIASYIFPHSEHSIVENLVCGVSLGGHAAWHCVMQDSRINAAIVVVGCPDYLSLMSERALLSKLDTAGPSFFGSEDFPGPLLEAVQNYDPAGQLVGIDSGREERVHREPLPDERAAIMPTMRRAFQGKRILNMAGGADKLVPYSKAEPFLAWLKRAIAPNGFFSDGDLRVKDIVFEGVGHSFSPGMAEQLNGFLIETLQDLANAGERKSRL